MKNAIAWSVLVLAITLLGGCQKSAGTATAAADYKHYSLVGKVMCGYQGWFNCPNDGSGQDWRHWSKSKTSPQTFTPADCHVDIWPDTSEMGSEEKCEATAFATNDKHYYVFSSHNRKTVLRHFEWMKEFGIDGVYVQRFANEVKDQNSTNAAFANRNDVLSYCRDGANMYGRKYAVMYDLSGIKAGEMGYVMRDWKYLVDTMKTARDGSDTAYMYHRGKPVVAVWGIGFEDKKHKRYSLEECGQLIDFLKNDPIYGGCTVMVGVPSYWRAQINDSVNDVNLHSVIAKADIISPWSVGRFKMEGGPADYNQTDTYAKNVWEEDVKWCEEKNLEYLPVVFAGFSYHNASSKKPLNEIPRWGGNFMWRQFYDAKNAGANMIYVAMFDEVDEGTAILKGANSTNAEEKGAAIAPPTPQFILYREDIAGQGPGFVPSGAIMTSDYYLWLTGKGGKMLRGEMAVSAEKPKR